MTNNPLIKTSSKLQILFSLLCFSYVSVSCSSLTNTLCIEQERDTLIKIKARIEYDAYGMLTSWSGLDCCTWRGVSCNKRTGHVVKLDFGKCTLGGQLSPSIGELERLTYIDLSNNDFFDLPIPRSIGSLASLRYLNLSNSHFVGEVPIHLGHLTRLTSLDLSDNEGLRAGTLNWLSRLTLLKDIKLNGVDLSNNVDLFRIIADLPLLEVLEMDRCNISTPDSSCLPYDSSYSNNLRVISLSGNGFTGSSIFGCLFTNSYTSLVTSLNHLDLSRNFIQGGIPDVIADLKSVMYLDLSYNKLSGPIPSTLQHFDNFEGNPGLCGAPLNRSCESSDNDHIFYLVLYLSIWYGSCLGFWVFFGTLAAKMSWRTAYFRFIDDVIDKIYVLVVVYVIAKFRRNSG